jgi:4-alpha-glucanotransferase
MDDLTAAARLWGIEAEYYDGLRNRHNASAETLTRLIAAISAGAAQPTHSSVVSGAQRRAHQGDGRRLWGIAVQLYALRSHRNWGHGDFTDLSRLIALAAARGASAIGLNPLHTLFPDRAEDASPYSPNSRLFLNPLYIDVEAIPEFPGVQAAGLESEIAALRESELIVYGRVARAKLTALHLAHRNFRADADAPRRADFESYRDEHGDALLRFSCFEVLRQRFSPKPWPQWPEQWRRPDNDRLKMFRQENDAECEFHEFVQWVADRQVGACQEIARRQGMPIGLYTDLAVGIDRDGADAWLRQDVVLTDVSIGAPPDEFNPGGQDWGLAPFNPQALPAHDFAAMRELLHATMRHAGALRIDHVFGLQRLFLFPRGVSAADGTYVRFPFEPLLRVIAEESNRFRCIVVGEDLGTVPDNFRKTVASWGLWGCCVMLFEREADGRFRAPDAYPAEALATFNTHDMASHRGWLEGHDLRVKRAMGFDPGETDDARAQSQAALREALNRWVPSYPAGDVAAIAAFLGATPSRLVVIALDDILGVRDQINVPATLDQHPNWRRKLPVAIEDLDTHAGLGRVVAAFTQAGRNFAG